MKKTVKVVILQALLTSYIFLPLCTCQQFTQTGTLSGSVPNTQFQGAVPNTFFQGAGTGSIQKTFNQNVGGSVPSTFTQGTVPSTFSQGVGAIPNTFFQDPTVNMAAKGYSNTPVVPNTYMSAPVHGQYWTGHVQHYPQHNQPYYPQQYPTYGQYAQYPGQYGQYPSQYGQYPAQYGQYPASYGQYPMHYGQYPASYGQYPGQYGQYQGFDAQYWTGQYYPHQVPAYQQYGMPVYHGGMAYPGQYMHHQQYYGGYPYQNKPWYKKGFLSGTGKNGLAKTILGAVVVGTVAKAVAKG